SVLFLLFFFNDPATTEIYTLSLHDALPILAANAAMRMMRWRKSARATPPARSEEHTSELQSHLNLVCRLLLEKKYKQMGGLNCRPAMGEKTYVLHGLTFT